MVIFGYKAAGRFHALGGSRFKQVTSTPLDAIALSVQDGCQDVARSGMSALEGPCKSYCD